MKTKIFYILIFLVTLTKLSQAQAPFIYASITNSAGQNACSLNQSVYLNNTFCNFPLLSTISGTINWGDGNIVPLTNFQTTTGPFSCDSLWQTLNHTYTTGGLYTVTVTQNGPGATPSIQTLSINNQGPCIDYSGYVYTDANSNCVYDIGEAVSPFQFIMLTTPNQTYYASTDANGFYQFSGQLFTPGNSTISMSNPNGITCPLVQTYTVNTATANNLNFGYSNTASFGTLQLSSSPLNWNCTNSFSFFGYLNVCNIPNGTPVSYTINYGDGTIVNNVVNYVSGPNACDSISMSSIVAAHTYATQGIYTVTVTATAMGTLTSSGNAVVTTQNCMNISGYLFMDANNNCVFDATEQPNAFAQVTIATSTAVYPASSDQNGFYSFSTPLVPGNYTVTPSVPLGSSLSCPAQSPFVSNIPTQTNVNFGYNPPAPSISGSLMDSTICNSFIYGGTLYFTSCGLPANTTYTININFGDGNSAPATVTSYNIGGGCMNNYGNVTHTYAAIGTYYLTATITGGGVTTVLYDTAFISNCGTVSGYTYLDANNNCIFDAGEQLPYQDIQVKLGNSILATGYSNASGYYNVQYPYISGNTYVVEANPVGNANTCYTASCPVALNYLVNTLTSSNLNFGFVQNTTSYDNAVTGILAWCCGILQAGANRTFKINYQNYLCGANNGTISVTLPSNFTYVSSSITPASIVGNVITWNYSNLTNMNWNNGISLVAYVPFVNAANVPYANGDPICLSATISSTSPGTDQNLSNNTYNTCFYIGTSYDPNDKHPFPKGEGMAGHIALGTELEYVIRFQNTGVFPAQQVYILDTLESDLDATSLQVLGTSHHMVFTQNGSALKFEFPNIMLPDSLSDPEGSMSFVRFKVKHNTNAPLGTIINNTASIYFDFNAPVITNTTINTLSLVQNVNEVSKSNRLNVYPNPAKETIQVSLSGTTFIHSVSIFNAMGIKVNEVNSDKNAVSISIKQLPAGVYFLQMKDQYGTMYSKHFVKE
jgi:hypothetical protein